jgi:cytochrome c
MQVSLPFHPSATAMNVRRFTVNAQLLALAVLFASPAMASEELAKKSACTACHAIDKKLVGPAYKDVAAKYAKQKDAETYLIEKVKRGGMGVWGPIPMPANPTLKDEDAKTLVKWVLALTKEPAKK